MKEYLSTGNNEHATPKELFENIKLTLGIVSFDIDLCANDTNKKCDKFYSKEENSLKQDWNYEYCWMNPPYSRDLQPKFIEKAYNTNRVHHNNIVCLIPFRPDIAIWHDYIYGKADIYIFRGRPKFYGDKSPTYPSAVVVYNNHAHHGIYTVTKDFKLIDKI